MSHNFVRFQVFHLLYLLSLMIKSISRLSSSFIKSLMLTKPLLKRSCKPVSLIFISAATSFKYLLSLRTSLLTHALNATGSANFSAAFHSFSVGFSNFTLSPLSLRVYSYVSTPIYFFDFFLPLVYIIAPLCPVVKSFFNHKIKSRAFALLTGINGVVFYNILCTEALFPAAFSRIECIARQL